MHVCGCGWTGVGECLLASNLTYPTFNEHALYFQRPLSSYHIFGNFLINGMIFGKKKLHNVKCVFWLSLQFWVQAVLILRRTRRVIVINWKCLHVKYLLLTSDFNKTWIFSADFREKLKCEILSKSVQWKPSCSMQTERRTDGQSDRQTDKTKVIVASRSSAKAPKSLQYWPSLKALNFSAREWQRSESEVVEEELGDNTGEEGSQWGRYMFPES
jgi:hypothetical protein